MRYLLTVGTSLLGKILNQVQDDEVGAETVATQCAHTLTAHVGSNGRPLKP
jgi:hypothetical protein